MPVHARFTALFSMLLLFFLDLSAAQAMSAREQTFKDWLMRCERKDENTPERCFILQIGKSIEDNQDVVQIVARYPVPNEPAILFMTLPLGVYLPAGLRLQIDNGENVRIDVEICIRNGCHVRVVLASELLEELRTGRHARLTFQLGWHREVKASISLAGFTAAFDALK